MAQIGAVGSNALNIGNDTSIRERQQPPANRGDGRGQNVAESVGGVARRIREVTDQAQTVIRAGIEQGVEQAGLQEGPFSRPTQQAVGLQEGPFSAGGQGQVSLQEGPFSLPTPQPPPAAQGIAGRAGQRVDVFA